MAVYKVPQDVEADDKLLGPFSFRQFIYLIIVALGIGMAWLLSKIFIGLAVIPIPVIILFGALALPLKKDQPMEAYLSAMVSFYFIKPRRRLWSPDGLDSLVEITAPKTVEPERTKDISGDEAKERLGYLTDIVESRGWSVRGVGVPMHGSTSVNSQFVTEAQSAVDMFDDSDNEAQKFDQLIKQRRENAVQEINERMQHNGQQPVQNLSQPNAQPVAHQTNSPQPTVNNHFESNQSAQFSHQPIRQSISNEDSASLSKKLINSPLTPPGQSTSENQPSPDIIKLANESDGLTVADVARQAQRISNREHGLPDGEVEISLH